jgi:crotonobetainyl-CoA:carnitine CoA-transferase CaiB-like acyl-CoA transferase
VRVLDLSAYIAGPYGCTLLADQGADVIKVEPPGGDNLRQYPSTLQSENRAFLGVNRSKQGVVLDVKNPEGLAALLELVALADVLVHNFRPGAVERIGLGEDAVRAIRHDIVYVSISGFGDSGPYANQRAYDPVIQALSGLAEIQTDRDTGRPKMVRTIIADKTTALTAAQAITAALFARERAGHGQHVRIAMLDAMIAYLWPEAMPSLTFVGEERDPSEGEIGPDLVFATQDRYITAAALSDDEWAGMCRALNRQDLIDDPRFLTAGARSRNAVERREITAAELEKWSASEILPRLLDNDVPAAPVLSRFELLKDSQVQANHILEEHQSTVFGRVRQPRPAAQFDRTPANVCALAPLLGADNAAILSELGYSEDDITRLEHEQVLHNQPASALSE